MPGFRGGEGRNPLAYQLTVLKKIPKEVAIRKYFRNHPILRVKVLQAKS